MSTLIRPKLVLPYGTYGTDQRYGPDGTPAQNLLRSKLRRLFMPIPGGGEGGFNEAADVIEQLADGTNVNDLWAAYQAAVALRNRERSALMDFVSRRINSPTEAIPTGTSEARFERASEYGVPRSYRPAGEFAFLGFDFNWFDLGMRFTWEFLADADAAQVDAVTGQALEADNILMFQTIMWTLFNNVNRQTSIKKRPYTVYTFWNGADGEVPDSYRTNTFTASHNHYLVSGANVVDSGDLDDMALQLAHHGYKRSEGADLILMVNPREGDVIRNFRSVPNGGTAKYDFIAARGTPSFLIPRDMVLADNQVQPAPTLRGMEVIGAYGEFTIIQEDYIPIGYMVAFATGGRDSVQNPVGIREHANPALRGLRLVRGRNPDYPLQEAYYQRGMGTGIRHRGAGVVMQIKTSGAYEIPVAYSIQP